MKVLLSLAVLIIVSFICCNLGEVKGKNGIVYKNAWEYNDYIVSRQTKVVNYILDFVRTADTNLDAAEVLLDKGIIAINASINDIKGICKK